MRRVNQQMRQVNEIREGSKSKTNAIYKTKTTTKKHTFIRAHIFICLLNSTNESQSSVTADQLMRTQSQKNRKRKHSVVTKLQNLNCAENAILQSIPFVEL